MSLFTDRKWLAPALVAGAAVIAYLAFGVFGVHTLFIDDEVSEAAPVFATGAADASESQSDAGAVENDANEDDAMEDGSTAGGMEDESTAGAMEVSGPVTAASGSFVDGAHPTTGSAVVLTDGGSRRVLRLEEDFATDNGPDLNVYLASSADGFDEEYIDLGDLKGNIGSQNYDIPTDVDLGVYDTVVIWCVRFGVGFGSAELA